MYLISDFRLGKKPESKHGRHVAPGAVDVGLALLSTVERREPRTGQSEEESGGTDRIGSDVHCS